MKKMLPLVVILLALLSAAVLVGLQAGSGRTDGNRINVAVSVLPQAYFVERIGGERVNVTVMIPPGASPATYGPTPGQMREFSRARIYVKVGHPLFPFERAWFDKLLANNQDVIVVDASKGVELIPDDPHVWLDIKAMCAMTVAIEKALARIDPSGADVYFKNAAALLREIDGLKREIAGIISRTAGKKFMVYHPAWGYFAREFGLEQVAIEHDHKEPGAREMGALVLRARADGIRVIFVQEQFDSRRAAVIAEEIGGSVVALDPLAKDWPGGMRRAAEAFVRALK